MAEDTKTDEQRRADAQAKADAASARVAASRNQAQSSGQAQADQAAADKPKKTTSQNKAMSIGDSAKLRSETVATNRWAILKETDGVFDKDARKEVINICIMDPNWPPEINPDLIEEGNKMGESYTVQQIGSGVTIGMREGGEFESADGFGWKDAADKAAHGNPVGTGATRLADVGAA
jgi:hypothetical protein